MQGQYTETPKTRVELETMKQQFQNKVDALETEKQTAIHDGTIGEKMKDFDKRTRQLKKAMEGIDVHINIREEHI